MGLSSIIIPTWNNLEYLRKTLESIRENTHSNYEIIVIDNGSNDGTLEYLETKDVVVIRNERNLGFSRAVNQGIRIAKGDYLVLLNDDVEVTEGWLRGLIKCAESSERIGIVGGKLLSFEGMVQSAGAYVRPEIMSSGAYGQGFPRDHPSVNTERDVEYVGGACMLIKRGVIERIGLLDENFFAYFEDPDICWRARSAGFRVVYTPKCEVYHHEHKTTDRLPDREQIIHESRIYFFRKWGF